jgi:hypothetical protein
LRTGFYQRPTSKETAIQLGNPSLKHIVDTRVQDYLFICTKKKNSRDRNRTKFTTDDYNTFCDLLNKENFDDELLGHRIGGKLQNQILLTIKDGRRIDVLEQEEEEEGEEEEEEEKNDHYDFKI